MQPRLMNSLLPFAATPVQPVRLAGTAAALPLVARVRALGQVPR
jgi:hypothetical protein